MPKSARADCRFSGGIDQASGGASLFERQVEQECVREQLAANLEQVVPGPVGVEVELGPRGVFPGLLDQRLQGFGGLGVQRDAALGVALADRDPQPWVPVGVGLCDRSSPRTWTSCCYRS